MDLIFVGVAFPQKLVPNENFYVYGINLTKDYPDLI